MGARNRLGIGLSHRTASGTGMQEENVGWAGGNDKRKGQGGTGRPEEKDWMDKQERSRLDRQAGRNS
jgi:hypothetical protein